MRAEFIWGFLLCACGSSLAPPSGSTGSSLSFEPRADASSVPSVVRVHVASTTLDAGAVSLFQGELSSYYLGKIKSDDLPDALVARQIPIVSWRAQGELIVAPTHALAPDTYSLAASTGLLGEFQVAPAAPLLARLWPPADSAGTLSRAIYCGDGSNPIPLDPLLLEPGDISVTPVAGADDSGLFADRCFHFDGAALAPGQIAVPQPVVGNWALDPAPFSGLAADAELDAAATSSVSCVAPEIALGPGCAASADDRVIVHTPATRLLWTIGTEHGALLEVTNGNPFVVRGLTPGESAHLTGTVYDLSGTAQPFDLVVTMSAARERPVLNEELANPVGPEPQSEWLELVNDGVISLDLSHFSLRDGGGTTALPAAVLAPREYALLVRDDFAPSSGDVPPAPGTRLIRVPALGTAGLSNSGEPLALIDGAGDAVSALPAVATSSGESLRRRHTYSPDDDASAFSTGAPSPGAPND